MVIPQTLEVVQGAYKCCYVSFKLEFKVLLREGDGDLCSLDQPQVANIKM